MPKLFSVAERESVFLNEDALRPEFLPDLLPGREKELGEMASALEPIISKRQPASIFCFGPPGTGKTSSTKYVFKELVENNISCFYVNCWQNSTRQAVLSELSRAFGHFLPRRGLASDEVFKRVAEAARGKTVVIALDEVDRLFFGGQDSVLYDLLRLENTVIALVLLTNDENVLSRLDPRAKSSLMLKQVKFERYSPGQLREILSKRAPLALRRGAFDTEVLALCASSGAKHGGDARIAIEALWLSARNAEKRGAKAISKEDVLGAMHSQDELHASRAKRLDGLSEHEQKILDFLAVGEKESGEVYAAFGDLSERSLRNYLNLLENKRLIVSEDKSNVNGPGNTRVFRLS